MKRLAIFTHDAYGLGHVRRSIRIINAVARVLPKCSQLLITGSPSSHILSQLPKNADLVKIPTVITSGSSQNQPSTLNVGVAEICALRAEIILRAVQVYSPDIVLVDNFPLGTRHELLPMLRTLRDMKAHAVLGLRDILDPSDKVCRDWTRDGLYDIVERYYASLIVYGSQSVFDVSREYHFPSSIQKRVFYSGYVCDNTHLSVADCMQICSQLNVDQGKYILATVGGGGDGLPLIKAFLSCRNRLEEPAVIVTGGLMSYEDYQYILKQTGDMQKTIVIQHTDALPTLMKSAKVVVAMGGYNTCAEIMQTGAQALVVPRFWRPGEHLDQNLKKGIDAEQLVRAQSLSAAGTISMLNPRELTPETLGDAIHQIIARSPDNTNPSTAMVSLSGADQVAHHLISLCKGIDD